MSIDEITPTAARYPRPSLGDWLLLAIGLAFVVAGILILPSKPDVGIVTLVFFGSCTAVFLGTITRKLRYRRLQASRVEVVGGVPIYPKRGRLIGFTVWTLAAGLSLVYFGGSYPAVFRWLAGFVAGVAAIFLLGIIAGWVPGGFLQFDADGLTFGWRRWHTKVPWDAIEQVYEGELYDNPMLMLAVRDYRQLRIEPEHATARAQRWMAACVTWHGAPIAIMVGHYGIDLPVLTQAIAYYSAEKNARADLDKRSLPQPSQKI